MANLNQQVFHTGKQRGNDDRKVGLEKATKVYAWIDANLKDFVDVDQRAVQVCLGPAQR